MRPLDDKQLRRLLEWHEALLEDRSIPETDGDQQDSQLLRAQACLAMLDELRRGPDESSAEVAGDSSKGSLPQTLPLLESVFSPKVASLPHRFGKFEIVRVLGRGAHGLVFEARDTLLGRVVALKVPRPEILASDDLRERLRQESQAAALLSHPNLLPVHEVGAVGPIWFITSQYCAGPTLSEWLRQQNGPLDARVAAEIIRQLAETTHYVHGFGILHRDIKPGNILLDPEVVSRGESPGGAALDFTPKLTDFGLAKLQEGAPCRTRTGAIVGTPAYMSPEQAAGRTRDLSPATDVYGLGSVLYELLTTHTPFTGQSDAELIQNVCRGGPVPLRRWRRTVPADLEAVCMKCLELEPWRRYPTAGELAADLQRFLEGEPVRARRVGPLGRTARWARRQPLVAALTTLLLLVVVVGLLSVVWLWQRAENLRQRAESNFQRAHAAVNNLHNVLLRSDDYDGSAYYPLRRDVLRSAVSYYRQLLADHPDDRTLQADFADALYQLAFVEHSMGQQQDARESYTEALQLWEQLVEMEPEQLEHQYFLAKVHGQLATLKQDHPDPKLLIHHAATCVQLREGLVRARPDESGWKFALVDACSILADLYREIGRCEEAYVMLERAEALGAEVVRACPERLDYRRMLAHCHKIHAQLLYVDHRYQEAVAHSHLGQETLGPVGEPSGEPATIQKTRASLWTVEALAVGKLGGRVEEARRIHHQAIETFERLVQNHPHVGAYVAHLQRARDCLADFEASLELNQPAGCATDGESRDSSKPLAIQ